MARVLGTGGAARAIVAALAGENVVIVLAGRDPAKRAPCSTSWIRDGEHHAVDLAHFAGPTDFAFDDRGGCFDLVVNASPLGHGWPAAAGCSTSSHVPPGGVVYDIVTHPLDTPLLQAARVPPAFRTIDGLADADRPGGGGASRILRPAAAARRPAIASCAAARFAA